MWNIDAQNINNAFTTCRLNMGLNGNENRASICGDVTNGKHDNKT